MSRTDDIAFERGLPANLDADPRARANSAKPSAYVSVAGGLDSNDFSLDANRRIYGETLIEALIGAYREATTK